MKRFQLFLASFGLLAVFPMLNAQPASKGDIDAAITRGLDFLKSRQDKAGGHWVTSEDPALSALVLSALVQDVASEKHAEALKSGYDFLLRNVQKDGGIYAKARQNYNTSICLMALVLRARAEDEEIIRRARRFVAGQQNDADTPGKTDNPSDGGIGYGGAGPGGGHADLSNTTFALEALYYSKKMFQDSGRPVEKKDDLNWDAAIQFITRCQDLKGSNDQPWAGQVKENEGAFGYTPVPQAPRGGAKKDGKPVPMRCYGSISYAGMLSFIYAGLSPSDPRVKAALEWLGENYTVEENPGQGAEGLFYYYHTMAKALATAGIDQLKTKSGSADWRADLSRKLISLQSADGSWANAASGRWMESDPVLCTAYTVLALQQVRRVLE